MKNLKKIAAVVLTASMILSVTGCAMGGKLSPKKLIASAKKNGCEQIKDADDFADMIEDGDDLEDGAYITVSGKDCKDIFKATDVFDELYDKSIKSATIVAVIDEDRTYFAYMACLSFGSKKDAQEFYEEQIEGVEDLDDDTGYDVDDDDGKENGITYTCVRVNMGIANISEGIYVSGSNVYVVAGYGFGDIDDYDDYLEDIGGCYDVPLPTEL